MIENNENEHLKILRSYKQTTIEHEVFVQANVA